MKETTLCYIEKENKYLMLYRNKKENDANEGKWIGIGGRIEENESPDECLLREVYEETGLTVNRYKKRGVIKFVSDIWETEIMHLYTADGYVGEMKSCDEGELHWIDKDKVMDLNLWEGDRIFLKLLDSRDELFNLELVYEGDKLVKAILDEFVLKK